MEHVSLYLFFTGVQVNPCDARPCQNGGRCTSSGNQYRCECPSGFTGRNCEQSEYLTNAFQLSQAKPINYPTITG